MTKASQNELKGILGINRQPLVSKDFNHDSHSSVFDVTQTQVIKNKFSRTNEMNINIFASNHRK